MQIYEHVKVILIQATCNSGCFLCVAMRCHQLKTTPSARWLAFLDARHHLTLTGEPPACLIDLLK